MPDMSKWDLDHLHDHLPVKAWAAPDDLSQVVETHPFIPNQQGVFLKNNNRSRGVVAAIRVDAPSGLIIESPDRLTSRRRWPLRFEVRIPPGSQVLLGTPIFKVVLSVQPGSTAIDQVNQTYTVEGAYYRDPPYPPSNDSAIAFFWLYSAPILGGGGDTIFDFAVNLHPNRPFEVQARTYPNNDRIGFSVNPGWELPVATGLSQEQRFYVEKIDFIGPAISSDDTANEKPK